MLPIQDQIKTNVLNLVQAYKEGILNDEFIANWADDDWDVWKEDGIDIINVGWIWHKHLISKFETIANDNNTYTECEEVTEDQVDMVSGLLFDAIGECLEFEFDEFIAEKYKLYDEDLFKPKQV